MFVIYIIQLIISCSFLKVFVLVNLSKYVFFTNVYFYSVGKYLKRCWNCESWIKISRWRGRLVYSILHLKNPCKESRLLNLSTRIISTHNEIGFLSHTHTQLNSKSLCLFMDTPIYIKKHPQITKFGKQPPFKKPSVLIMDDIEQCGEDPRRGTSPATQGTFPKSIASQIWSQVPRFSVSWNNSYNERSQTSHTHTHTRLFDDSWSELHLWPLR